MFKKYAHIIRDSLITELMNLRIFKNVFRVAGAEQLKKAVTAVL